MAKVIKSAIQYSLALALLVGMIWWSNPGEVGVALSNLTLEWVLLIALVAIALLWASVLKWRLFLEYFGESPSTWKLSRAYLIGYFVNAFLPSQMGGDVARSLSVGRSIGQYQAATATILERYTGLVAMLVLSFIVMWFAAGITWQIKSLVVVASIGVVVLTFFALSPKLFSLLTRIRVGEKFIRSLSKIQSSFVTARESPLLLIKGMMWSFVFHGAAIFNVYIIAHAVGWDNASFADLVTVVPIILLLGNIPLTPSNIGIQEGVYLFFLSSIGCSKHEALAIALILRAKTYVLAGLGWVAWISEKAVLEKQNRSSAQVGRAEELSLNTPSL